MSVPTTVLRGATVQARTPQTARPFCSTCFLLHSHVPKAGEPSSPRRIVRPGKLAKLAGATTKLTQSDAREGSATSTGGSGGPYVRARRGGLLGALGLEGTSRRVPPTPSAATPTNTRRRPTDDGYSEGGDVTSAQAPAPKSSIARTASKLLEGRFGPPIRETRASPPRQRYDRKERIVSAEGDMAASSSVEMDDSKVKFIGIDLETSLPRIHGVKLAVFRSPLFNMRAFPSRSLPARPPPPFPLDRIRAYRQARVCVYAGVTASKAAVSKLAVERNRTRRRFKVALNEVVNGPEDVGGRNRTQRRALVSPEYAYITSLTAEAHDADLATLKSEVLSALSYLGQRQPITWKQGARLPEPRYLRPVELDRELQLRDGSEGA